ncbi:fasciclin domain-containing protein [Alteromonas flava]|uniref:fasciclin domain-containing protein n=1 Tax=Alteromonas flava TaxID=2048003 RepID=UPI001F0CB912|nr:fasciclin domain-containing protein [Alteromonas flava]
MNMRLKSTIIAAALIGVAGVAVAGGNYTKSKHSQPDIVDIAAGNANFTTLVAALKAADLTEALEGKGPFTVFAPTNDAFAKLPAGTVETLLKPENKHKLIDILTYHVVPGEIYAKEVVNLSKANSLQGDSIDIAVSMGTVTVDGAKVIQTDIKGSNGVIHVIDNVILPNS